MTNNDNLYDEPRNADLVIENHNEIDTSISAIKITNFFIDYLNRNDD